MSTIVKTFQPRFSDLVESGKKLTTIRPVPKRMPKVGDTILLRAWSGLPYRSNQRRLGEGLITSIDRVMIDCPSGRFRCFMCDRELSVDDWNDLAIKDGFEGRIAMTDWFLNTHGLPFEGILIQWRKTV